MTLAGRQDPLKPFLGHAKKAGSFKLPQDRERWLEARRTGVGGSDAAALMGSDPYRGPFAIYMAKVASGGDIDEHGQSEAAYWGHVLEDVVAKEFSKRSGFPVHNPSVMLRSRQYPWMLATMDRVAIEPHTSVPLEVKTRSAFKSREWLEEPPLSVLDQLLHYCIVAGANHGYVALLLGGQSFHMFHVAVEDYAERVERMVQVERDFWTRVQEGNPPEPDGTDASRQILSDMFPTADPSTAVQLSPEAQQLLVEHYEVRTSGAPDARQRLLEVEARLKAHLGDAEYGLVGDRPVVAWRNVVRRGIDVKLLRKRYPDIAKEVTRETTTRAFRVLSAIEEGEVAEPE